MFDLIIFNNEKIIVRIRETIMSLYICKRLQLTKLAGEEKWDPLFNTFHK